MEKEEKKEEKKEEEVKEEEIKEPETTPIIDEANKAAELMRIENDRKEKLIEREEKLAVQNALGGRSEGGAPEVKKEESPTDYAKRVLAGEANPLKDDGFI